MKSMKNISLLERYYMLWKTEQLDLKTFLMNLESKIQELDDRLSRLEAENEEIKKLIENEFRNNLGEMWVKIRGYTIENNTSFLLNPSKRYRFNIIEVDENFIRVDKLGKIRLTKNMFISVYEMLKKRRDWVNIGSSVKNTKPHTVEGHLKSNFFGGNMNGQMTASWVSAILVRSNVGIIFNDKALGQAIRYNV